MKGVGEVTCLVGASKGVGEGMFPGGGEAMPLEETTNPATKEVLPEALMADLQSSDRGWKMVVMEVEGAMEVTMAGTVVVDMATAMAPTTTSQVTEYLDKYNFIHYFVNMNYTYSSVLTLLTDSLGSRLRTSMSCEIQFQLETVDGDGPRRTFSHLESCIRYLKIYMDRLGWLPENFETRISQSLSEALN